MCSAKVSDLVAEKIGKKFNDGNDDSGSQAARRRRRGAEPILEVDATKVVQWLQLRKSSKCPNFVRLHTSFTPNTDLDFGMGPSGKLEFGAWQMIRTSY